MSNILLTGANGFLGSNLRGHLSSLGHKIFTLGRSNCDINHDLKLEIHHVFPNLEVVIHAAGHAHFNPKTTLEKEEFFDVNVLGTINLLMGLEKSSVLPEKFVFISSVSVYGLDFGENINEDSILLAEDPYGLSKKKAEKLVLDWCNNNNVICTILRLPLLVGQNASGNLGLMIKGIKKGYYFNIAGGTARKSMVLVEDVAKWILKASTIGGIYNLTDGYHPSFSDFSNIISHQLGKSKPKNISFFLAKILSAIGDFFGPNSPLNTKKLKKMTSDLTFDDTKARKVFGWDPKSVLEGFRIY